MRYLKIQSLPKSDTWIDRDYIMLHACFQILKDAVEKEGVDTHVHYESCKEFVDEVRFLYNWWEERCKEDVWGDDEERDNEMLNRLFKIRQQLWT